MSSNTASRDRLDLHGVRHSEVSRMVDIFLTETINSEFSFLYIVTGVSDRMQDIVIETIKDYNLDYDIGDPWNYGYIRIKLT
mgnify:FL=1